MSAPMMRVLLGFVAAALSVLTFHQGMWAALHFLAIPGLEMPPPFPTRSIPPLGVPQVLNLCFWGGLYGAVFGLILPRLTAPLWLCGLVLGLIAAFVGIFLVPAIKGLPMDRAFMPSSWVRSLLINGCWGIGVGIILPLILRLSPRRL